MTLPRKLKVTFTAEQYPSTLKTGLLFPIDGYLYEIVSLATTKKDSVDVYELNLELYKDN